MRVTVVGAGAIGGFIAGALARSGIPTAIVARGAHLAAIRERGIRVRSQLGDFSVRVDAAENARDLPPADLLVLTFKAHQWPHMLDQLVPAARNKTPIVTMQNGVPFWFVRRPPLESVDPGGRIGALFSEENVIGGVVHVSGHIVEPGVVAQSGGLRYLIGEASGTNGERVGEIAAAFRSAGLRVEIDGALRRSIWFKLAGNASLNPVSALTGLTVGSIVRDADALEDVRALMMEVLEVGRALGLVRDVRGEAEARIAYAARLDDVKTSMLQDMEAGRPLEIEPILGAVVELSERTNVATPRLRAVLARLRESTVSP